MRRHLGEQVPQLVIRASRNELTLGFVATVAGAVATYLTAVGVVLRDLKPRS
jgi:hypothetical protein